MIKYNCGGAGLTTGLTNQVENVVSLLPAAANVIVNLRDWDTNVGYAGQEVLRPFKSLSNQSAQLLITGRVTEEFATWLTSVGGGADPDHTDCADGNGTGADDVSRAETDGACFKPSEECSLSTPMNLYAAEVSHQASNRDIFSQYSRW